ncbi:MAG TPA: hypothetical protein VMU50_16460 [Polyangia bacterium]|nr:hypothetical protein [Polyangia bacterium]
MRISELRSTALEALCAGAVGLGLAWLISPGDLALHDPGPHVVWIAVIVIAARYGTEGLLLALPLVWGPLVAVAGLVGALGALGARLDRAQDLAGLVAAVLVGWVASTHEKRHKDLTAVVAAAREHSAAQQSLLGELEETCLALCARTDRLDVSLSFLRHVAARIEGGDMEAAAEATLALAMARLGARAGMVQLHGAARAPRTLAAAGAWSEADGATPDLRGDRAVAAALSTCKPIRAIDLHGAAAGDADLVAPLLDQTGVAVGVLAVRGVPQGGASPAALQDLSVVGGWLAGALARGQDRGGAEDDDVADFEKGEIDYPFAIGGDPLAEPYFELQIFPSPAFGGESERAS